MSNKVINIQEEVNPHFKQVWTTKKPYNVLKGGRSSFKSSVIALLLVYMLIPFIQQGNKANIVVIRKVANTLRDSVFLKVQWALGKFHLLDEFSCTVSPFKITHKVTESTFYFYGQDDFQKLKSNDINDLIAVWYEEAAEFENKEDFDQTNATFIRQKHELAEMVKIFWSYNPPRNPYSWINEWSDELESEPNYMVHKSSYMDDELGFVTEQMLEEINRIKENDYDYYRYLYLGEPVGLGTNVYNIDLFKRVDDIPSEERPVYIYYGTDGGHASSATTHLCCVLTNRGNLYLVDTYYYSPDGKVVKKAPSELSEELNEFITRTSKEYMSATIRSRIIDSAEAALRNQYYKDYGQRINGSWKKPKKITMIDYVHAMLAQGRIYVLNKPTNDIFIEEHKKYQFVEKTLMKDNPSVIDEDDHTCDAFQYIIYNNARDLNLKV